jgi:XTP/dITP diphosphohydrolase
VEHTWLYLAALNGFPAGLTQIFWDTLGADKVSELFGKLPDTSVCAKTKIGYCDGKKIQQFEGEIRGNIAPQPQGNREFHEGHNVTLAQMGQEKKRSQCVGMRLPCSLSI